MKDLVAIFFMSIPTIRYNDTAIVWSNSMVQNMVG